MATELQTGNLIKLLNLMLVAENNSRYVSAFLLFSARLHTHRWVHWLEGKDVFSLEGGGQRSLLVLMLCGKHHHDERISLRLLLLLFLGLVGQLVGSALAFLRDH